MKHKYSTVHNSILMEVIVAYGTTLACNTSNVTT